MNLALGLVSYLWFCAAWFNHDLRLGFVSDTPPVVPGALFLVSTGIALFRRRAAIVIGARRTRRALPRARRLSHAASLRSRVLRTLQLRRRRARSDGAPHSRREASSHLSLQLVVRRKLESPSHRGARAARLRSGRELRPRRGAGLRAGHRAVYYLSRTIGSRAESDGRRALHRLRPGFLTAWGMGNEGSYPDVLALGTLMLALGFRFLKDEVEGLRPRSGSASSGASRSGFTSSRPTTFSLPRYPARASIRKARLSPACGVCGGLRRRRLSGNPLEPEPRVPELPLVGSRAPRGKPAPQSSGASAERSTQLAEVFQTSFAVLAGYWPKANPPRPASLFHVVLLVLFPLSFAVFAFRYRGETSPARCEAV